MAMDRTTQTIFLANQENHEQRIFASLSSIWQTIFYSNRCQSYSTWLCYQLKWQTYCFLFQKIKSNSN